MIGVTPTQVQQVMNGRGLGAYWNANDPLQSVYDQIVATYYATISTKGGHYGEDPRAFMYMCLMARQVPARKKVNGDCGTATSIKPSGIATGTKIAGAVVSSGTAVASTVSAVGSLGWAGAIGVAGGIAGLALLPFGIWAAISMHHKVAVEKEQSADCDATNYFNQYAAAVVQAVQANTLDWRTAKSYFDTILKEALGPLGTTSQNNPCNAGCVTTAALKCVHDLFVILYGQPAPPHPVIASSANAASATVAAQTPGPLNPDGSVNTQYGASTPNASGVGLAVGAGAVGLHFLGAF